MFALNVLSVRLFDLLYPTISIATCVSYAWCIKENIELSTTAFSLNNKGLGMHCFFIYYMGWFQKAVARSTSTPWIVSSLVATTLI